MYYKIVSVTSSVFKKDQNNIYVNASLYNNTTQTISAILEITLTQPILDQSDKYKMCVVRFDIPLSSLQNSIMNIVMDTIFNTPPGFSVGFLYKNQVAAYSVAPQNPINTMADFVNFINKLSTAALEELVLSYGITVNDPYLYWDPTTHLLNYVYPYYLQSQQIFPIFSQPLFNIIGSFPYIPSGTTVLGQTVPEGYVMLDVVNTLWVQAYVDQAYSTAAPYSNTAPSGATYNALRITQEFNTSYNFSNHSKVVLPASLPVRSEFLPNSGVINAGD